MEKVENKAIIRKIGLRSIKHNKTVNRIVVLAIVLMTFMFTSVFSIGFSLAKNLNLMMIRQNGTIAKITLDKPSSEQLEQIRKCTALYHAGISMLVEKAKPTTNEDFKINLICHNEENFRYNISPALENIKGTYPQKENEIMVSESGLKALGMKSAKTGDTISLKINDNTETFVLSGYYVDFGFRTNNYDAFVSEKFAEKYNKTFEENGTAYISAKKSQAEKLENQIDNNVIMREEQNITFTSSDDNDSLLIGGVILFICFVITLSGYLLIYNIMYISVNKNIRFYGMLKTIGTTSKQIRKIVKTQAFRMALYGIPLGVISGFILSFVIVPFATDSLNSTLPTTISFNPFIFIGTILFALFTILISCRKPAKFAGNVTPVEALKYNGSVSEKTKSYKSDNGGKLYKMAFRNISRDKKRTSVVMLSLILGIIALFATQTFLKSLDLHNYIDNYFPYDFVVNINITDDEDFQKKDSQKAKASLKLAEDIKNISDTDVFLSLGGDIDAVYNKDTYMPLFKEYSEERNMGSADDIADYFDNNKDNFTINISGIDKKSLERFNKKSERKVDIDKFENGEICLIGMAYNESTCKEMESKIIELKNTKNGKTMNLKTGLCLNTRDNLDNLKYGSSWWQIAGAPDVIFVSQKVINELADEKWVSAIAVNCTEENEPAVNSEIKKLTENNICIPSKSHVESKSETIETFKSSIISMRILTIGISSILILIGIVNFINVMFVGLITRKNEFAVMESIGMTKKQIYKLLAYEGFYYSGFVTLLILTAGNAVIFTMGNVSQKIADYAVFHYPCLLVLSIIIIISLICVSVPVVAYKSISKKSIVERLRENN